MTGHLGYQVAPYRDQFEPYFSGVGIEIGALCRPMPLNPDLARVFYVDWLPVEALRQHYPEYNDFTIVRPDVLADAHRTPFRKNSRDFVIANHLLEHLPDPIGALTEWYRILRPGGVIFLALPDKRRTFDRDRPRTTLSHLIEDHSDGGAASTFAHYEEWARLVVKAEGDDAIGETQRLLAIGYNIHFHVWIPEDIEDLLRYLRVHLGLRWQILKYLGPADDTDEFIYVLKKPGVLSPVYRSLVRSASKLARRARRIPGRLRRAIQSLRSLRL